LVLSEQKVTFDVRTAFKRLAYAHLGE
jgi:hypothetical protein